jgi:hypothetical protein
MRHHRLLAGILLRASAGFVACSDDDGTGLDDVTLADLAGSYSVQGFTYTSDADPNTSVNLISATNATLSVTLLSNGSFSGLLNAPSLTGTADDVPIAGTLTLTGNNTADVDFDAATNLLFSDLEISFQFSDPNFVWTANDVSFDFSLMNDPDNAEAADLIVVLVRTT